MKMNIDIIVMGQPTVPLRHRVPTPFFHKQESHRMRQKATHITIRYNSKTDDPSYRSTTQTIEFQGLTKNTVWQFMHGCSIAALHCRQREYVNLLRGPSCTSMIRYGRLRQSYDEVVIKSRNSLGPSKSSLKHLLSSTDYFNGCIKKKEVCKCFSSSNYYQKQCYTYR